ncbi:MAG: hypothetical protein L6Q97_25440, partial [Thermoanaerobaculia bacterium]|nr:hypothetical protein [Thermoanaerobaculia bacterium]
MRHAFYVLALLFLLLMAGTEVLAQPKHSLAFRHSWYNYLTPLGTDNLKFEDVYQNTTGRGVELAYYNRLLKNTFFVIPLKIGTSQLPDQAGNLSRQELVGNLDLLLQLNLFKYGSVINPYLQGGIGT